MASYKELFQKVMELSDEQFNSKLVTFNQEDEKVAAKVKALSSVDGLIEHIVFGNTVASNSYDMYSQKFAEQSIERFSKIKERLNDLSLPETDNNRLIALYNTSLCILAVELYMIGIALSEAASIIEDDALQLMFSKAMNEASTLTQAIIDKIKGNKYFNYFGDTFNNGIAKGLTTQKAATNFNLSELMSLSLTTIKFIKEQLEESAKPEKKENDDKDSDELSDKELIDAWNNCVEISGQVKGAVSSLITVLTELYKSGIVAIPQSGILCELGSKNPPLCCIKANDVTGAEFVNNKDSGYGIDVAIKQALAATVPNFTATTNCDPTTLFPKYEQLMNETSQCIKLHLMFQSANIAFSGKGNNKNSIRKWISATKKESSESWLKKNNVGANGKVSSRLKRWDDVVDWYRWVLTCQAYRYFDAAGLKPDEIYEEETVKISAILSKMSAAVQNVVVVSERELSKGVMQTTELKILCSKPFEPEVICAALGQKLNTGGTNVVKANVRSHNKNINLATVAITFGSAKGKSLFAYQVLPTLLDSGGTISWNNVLLGRAENGAFQFRNFESAGESTTAAHYQYAIYAGSGSGKGNMTLNILAAALVSGLHIFYVDCKADSAGALGNIAWREKKEAFCFDGIAVQENQFALPTTADGLNQPFENHPVLNGVRKPNESKDYFPTLLSAYLTPEKADKFLGVCRYMRCIELAGKMIEARCTGKIPRAKRAVFIFDEVTKIAKAELDIIKEFYTILEKEKLNKLVEGDAKTKIITGFKTAAKDWPETFAGSEILQFIYNWFYWSKSISRSYEDALASSLRNSDTTLFMIFQNAKWLADLSGKYTAIGAFANLFGNTCYKIVGKGFNANGCGNYGDASLKDAKWMNLVGGDAENDSDGTKGAAGAGYWAISNGADIRQGTPTLFKPYSIWGYPKADYTGGSDENFFAYYIDMLKSAGNFDPASVLQEAYTYADNAIRTLGEAGIIIKTGGVKEYIYNASDFTSAKSGFDADSYKGSNPEGGSENLADELRRMNGQPEGGAGEQSEGESNPFDGFNGEEQPAGENPVAQPRPLRNPFEEFGEGQASGEQPKPGERPGEEEFNPFDGFNGRPASDDQTSGSNPGSNPVGADYRNINSMSRKEADTTDPLFARRTGSPFSKHFTTDKFGNLIIAVDTSKLSPEQMRYIKTGKEGNAINFDHPVLTDDLFVSGNERKINKAITKCWKIFVKRMIANEGGKSNIHDIQMDSQSIFINKKIVTHDFLTDYCITSLAQVVDFVYLLESCPIITTLRLSTEMTELLDSQLSDLIIEYSVKTGKEVDLAEYLFKNFKMLNTVILNIDSTPLKLDKVQVLKKSEPSRSQIIKERLANISDTNKAKKQISNVKSQYSRTKGFSTHSVPRTRKTPKMGFFRKSAVKVLDWFIK